MSQHASRKRSRPRIKQYASLFVLLSALALTLWTRASGTTTSASDAYEDEAPAAASRSRGPTATRGIERLSLAQLSAAEQAAVLETLQHIDAGTQPTGPLAKKWRAQFKNWSGDLPGPRGESSPFREFRVEPAPGTAGAGPRRIVTNPQTREVFYTWTHYGDSGEPAFVQLR
jgi:guanyl-specific ribonuclease Sa